MLVLLALAKDATTPMVGDVHCHWKEPSVATVQVMFNSDCISLDPNCINVGLSLTIEIGVTVGIVTVIESREVINKQWMGLETHTYLCHYKSLFRSKATI